MEASALRYSGGIGLQSRSPLLRLQSDEGLISMVRRGSPGAFEVLVARYQARLLAFCRHLLGSREDAEDVLQEVLAAAFNAILADERAINVRPWLYRIARNRCLNHLRRTQAVGMDSMDVHLSEHGASTADKVHGREEFRMLVHDIRSLPETQRTALVLREMDALSYDQIAEAMETTVPGVKSLLVRARVSLAEAAEARLLSCEEVRIELAEVAEGLQRKAGPLARRHLRSCKRCSVFNTQLKRTNKALAALLPVGPLALLHKIAFAHVGHSAGAGSSASGASAAGPAAAIGSTAAAGTTAMLGSGTGGIISMSIGTIATKAAAGLAAAALVTAGAAVVSHGPPHHPHAVVSTPQPVAATPTFSTASVAAVPPSVAVAALHPRRVAEQRAPKHAARVKKPEVKAAATTPATKHARVAQSAKPTAPAGRTQTQTVGTVLPNQPSTTPVNDRSTATATTPTGTAPSGTTPGGTTPTTTGTAPTTTTTTPTTTPTSTGASTTLPPPPAGTFTVTGSGAATVAHPVRHAHEIRRRHRRRGTHES